MTILLFLLAVLTGEPAHARCSIAALPVFRDPAATYLVGTATADTTLAAPGGPAVGLPGLLEPPRRAAFGQLVRVQDFRGPDSTRLERAFTRRGVRDVIVVPWSFGAACEPIPWPASTRWAPVDATVLYRLQLRPEAEWAGGPPVFDALFAELQPYPHGPLAPRPSDGPPLTPEELLELYSALPTERDAAERPDAARRALDAWELAHPELAAGFPAAAVLRNARATLDQRMPPRLR